jgi:hypothetical protein
VQLMLPEMFSSLSIEDDITAIAFACIRMRLQRVKNLELLVFRPDWLSVLASKIDHNGRGHV